MSMVDSYLRTDCGGAATRAIHRSTPSAGRRVRTGADRGDPRMRTCAGLRLTSHVRTMTMHATPLLGAGEKMTDIDTGPNDVTRDKNSWCAGERAGPMVKPRGRIQRSVLATVSG